MRNCLGTWISFFCLVVYTDISIGNDFINQSSGKTKLCMSIEHEEYNSFGVTCMRVTAGLMKDFIELQRNLFTRDTLKIISALAPIYMSARLIDPHLQSKFYDPFYHKNINQIHDGVSQVIEKSAFVVLASCASLAIIAPDEELRIVSKIFAIGALSGLWTKNIIKQIHFEGNIRPWNEKFSSKKRSYGGFPSGHMFEAAYTATVYGMHYGIKAGLPLSLFAAAMFGVSIVGNRHYLSQVVAGTGLGIIYAMATHALIAKRLDSHFSLDFISSGKGLPKVQLAYYF